MARKIVSLYIDDAGLRLLVMRGREILDWGELPLESGLVRGGEIVQEALVAEKIKLLMGQFGVRSSRVAVGVSGLFCLSRPAVLPPLPKNMLEEAVKREAKRLLPIPPDQCYFSWQVLPGPADKTHIFMVAIPRRIAGALYRTLHEAGLKAFFLDIKPLALASLSSEANAVIVDLQQGEYDIVVMSGGVPQPIRSVSLPDSAISDAEKLASIKNDVDRTIKFFNSNNPQKPIHGDVPLLVSGQLQEKTGLHEELAKATGMRVLPLQFATRVPAGFRESLYMTNIGLAMRQSPAIKESGSAVAGLNCLPTEFMPQPINLTRVLMIPAAVVILASLALFIALMQKASANISSVREEAASVNRTIASRQLMQKGLTDNITKFEKVVSQAEASLKTLSDAYNLIEQKRNSTNGDLVLGTGVSPEGTRLSSITYSAETMVIQGNSPDEESILAYARALSASARFTRVNVTSVKNIVNPKGPTSFDFVITVLLKGVG